VDRVLTAVPHSSDEYTAATIPDYCHEQALMSLANLHESSYPHYPPVTISGLHCTHTRECGYGYG